MNFLLLEHFVFYELESLIDNNWIKEDPNNAIVIVEEKINDNKLNKLKKYLSKILKSTKEAF